MSSVLPAAKSGRARKNNESRDFLMVEEIVSYALGVHLTGAGTGVWNKSRARSVPI